MPKAEAGFADRISLVANGPTIGVRIGYDPNYQPPSSTLVIPPEEYPALIDTGASESSIDARLAASLDLPLVDVDQVAGVGGPMQVNIHLAQIYIPALDTVVYGRFAAVQLSEGGQPQRALLGRTLLQHFTMVYAGNTGQVTLDGAP